MYTTCVPCTRRSEKKELDPWSCDAVSHSVDAGDQAWVLYKSNMSFNLLRHLSAPCPMFINTSQAGIIIRSDHPSPSLLLLLAGPYHL